jgi:hypothetical protein
MWVPISRTNILPPSSVLSSETFVSIYRTARCHYLVDFNTNHHLENIRSYIGVCRMYFIKMYHIQNVRQVRIKRASQEICKSEGSMLKCNSLEFHMSNEWNQASYVSNMKYSRYPFHREVRLSVVSFTSISSFILYKPHVLENRYL